MKVFGIRFAPFNIPLHRRLETLGISIACFLIIGLPIVSILVSIYLLLFTKYWWCIAVYAIWIIIDRETPEKGGRASNWVRSWTLFKYARDYFPARARVASDFKIDPKLNYLVGWFPHGLLPLGVPLGLTCGYGTEFSNHSIYTVTVDGNFYVPLFRDFILALGMCGASAKSISHLLNSPGGGKIVILPIGGSSEALNFKSGEYRIKLKNRKGFIKIAIKTGVPVIPIFSFGENDAYNQVIFAEGSLVRRFQCWVRKMINVAPLIFNGRGFFQYNFGMIPFRTPLNIVVGKPLTFGHSENPSQAEIDDAHQKFVDALTSLFEEHKHCYEKNPDSCKLIIE